MDARIESGCRETGIVGAGVRAIALLVAGASLLAAIGCATPRPATDGETAAASRSRCAPGAVLDDRHSLCNGQSGRWW